MATKADASTVYTKTDVDDKLATKADKATTLAGYGVTDAYTKEEVDENTVAKEQGVDNAGKVLGIGEDGNVIPVEVASNDPFPAEDDFSPIIYSTTSETPGTFDGLLQINLGSLSDGEYEFYLKTKPYANSNFMRHYFRITIKDGQIDWQYPNTYFTIAFDPTETGAKKDQSDNWATVYLEGIPIFGGKINNDYIIECPASAYPVAPGAFYWDEITNGDEIGQISKIRNIVTQETVTPIIILKEATDDIDSNLSPQFIGRNPFYVPIKQTITKSITLLYPWNTVKGISIGMLQILRPGSDFSGYEYALCPAEILVSIYSLATSDELDFVFKSDRSGISIQETKATGAFVGTKYAVYANSTYTPDYIELVLYKDSAFGFNDEEYLVSVTETGVVAGEPSVQTVYDWDSLPAELSLLQEITPISETTTGIIETDEPGVPRTLRAGSGSAVGQGANVAIGPVAKALGGDSTAVGYGAEADSGGMAIGTLSRATTNSMAIGGGAKVSAGDSIQLGIGTNATSRTFQVWDKTLMDRLSGLIPAARMANLPTSGGPYTLELTISGGIATTSWSVLDVYSKEETDQQIQNAIGTIETALAEV